MEPLSLEMVAAVTSGQAPEGAAAVRVTGAVLDSRKAVPGDLFVALPGERADGADFGEDAARRGATAALAVRPVKGLPTVVVDDVRTALAALGIFCRRAVGARVAAVTGSNGKTTVKELLAAMLRPLGSTLATEGNLNNELGVPLTLCRLDAGHRYAVIEMGANHAGEIYRLARWAVPDVGVVTQAAPAHLEGFGSLDGVARAKGELFEALPEDGVAVVNADDPYAPLWRQMAGDRRVVTFGAAEDADLAFRGSGPDLELRWDGTWIAAPSPLPGRHNAANVAAAAACARVLGADAPTVTAAVAAATSVPGRLQARIGVGGQRILDDSYNANPASLEAGLGCLAEMDGERWLVLGEMAELGSEADVWHRRAADAARKAGVQHLWTVGGAAPAAEAFGAGGRAFDGHGALIDALREALPETAAVLVKGSRAAGMDRVAAALTVESALAPRS